MKKVPDFKHRLSLIVYCIVTVFLMVLAWKHRELPIETDVHAMIVQHNLLERSELALLDPAFEASKRNVAILIEGKDAQLATLHLEKAIAAEAGLELEDSSQSFSVALEVLKSYQLALQSTDILHLEAGGLSVEKLRTYILAVLSSPTSISTFFDISNDPFLFWYTYSLEHITKLSEAGAKKQREKIVLRAHISEDVFHSHHPEELEQGIDSLLQIPDTYDATLTWSAYVRFAADGAKRLRGEIQYYSMIAGALVLAMTLIVFRSVWHILLCLLSVFYGLLAGIIVTVSCFGSIHAVTIGFGSGLIGVSVDYAIHFFCEYLSASKSQDGFDVLRRIFVPISIGTLTSVFVFCGLGMAGFPGLQELSLFALSGLLASYATVCVLFPRWVSSIRGSTESSMMKLSRHLFLYLHRFYLRVSPGGVYVVLCVLGLPAMTMLKTNDDVRLLQKPSAMIVERDRTVREAMSFVPNSFVILNADSLIELNKKLRLLETFFQKEKERGVLESSVPLTFLFPFDDEAEKRAKQRRDFFESHKEEIRILVQEIGYEDALLEGWYQKLHRQASIPDGPVYIRELQEAGVGQYVSYDRGRIRLVVPVQEALGGEGSVISPAIGKRVRLTELVSEVLKGFREKSTIMGVVSYLGILLFFCVRYGYSRGFSILLPSLVTGYLILACIAYSGTPLNFFHILGVIIVLGLSVDYNVFFYEEGIGHAPVCLTVLLSTVSTSFAFLPLSFSSTLILNSLGMTIGLGVLIATFLAPLGARSES